MSKEILGTSRISTKFQITIPKDVRDRFKLNADEIIVFWDESGKIVLRKNTEE